MCTFLVAKINIESNCPLVIIMEYHVTGMYVLVEGFLDQILRFKAGESGDPLVQEDQLQVQSCPEHYLGHQNLFARQTT